MADYFLPSLLMWSSLTCPSRQIKRCSDTEGKTGIDEEYTTPGEAEAMLRH